MFECELILMINLVDNGELHLKRKIKLPFVPTIGMSLYTSGVCSMTVEDVYRNLDDRELRVYLNYDDDRDVSYNEAKDAMDLLLKNGWMFESSVDGFIEFSGVLIEENAHG